MDSFGVVSPHLKKLAKKVTIPEVILLAQIGEDETAKQQFVLTILGYRRGYQRK